MNSLMFAYAQARQLEIELEVKRRHSESAPSVRDRLGRALIAWGEQLVALPPVPHAGTQSYRRAA